MRLNKFLAAGTSLSRRAADEAVVAGRVMVNGKTVEQGTDVSEVDIVCLDGQPVHTQAAITTIMLNKPRGYVVSKNGQGSKTVYDLLPAEYHLLNPIGRLDRDSSGLLLLTNDGQLAQELTHPSRQKVKVYEVALDRPLAPLHQQMIADHGIMLDDGISRFQVQREDNTYLVTMHEGRNRQIRRTFAALGYNVQTLHRIQFGNYVLGSLYSGHFRLTG